MHNRERGAAHINIYFFLVLLVAFLGTLWFGYMQLAQVKDAQQGERTAERLLKNRKADLRQLELYIEDLGKIVGSAGEYSAENETYWKERKGDYGTVADGSDEAYVPPKLTKVPVPKDVRATAESLARKLGIPVSQTERLPAFFGLVDREYSARLAELAEARSTLTEAQTALAVLSEKFDASTRERDDKYGELAQDFTRKLQDWDAAKNEVNDRILQTQAQVKAGNDRFDQQREEHAKLLAQMNKRHQRDQNQLEHMKSYNAMRNPPQAPDGTIVNASMKAGRAWVDIGRKDMLVSGTSFRIEGRDNNVKAWGKVVKVEQDRAELALYNVGNRIENPVTRGDKIYNEIYSPNLKRSVALIGRFSYPYTKPMIEQLLENLGNVVHDEVKVGVDLVIVGMPTANSDGEGGLQPIEELPGYKKAQELRCEIITVYKIRELLKLGD